MSFDFYLLPPFFYNRFPWRVLISFFLWRSALPFGFFFLFYRLKAAVPRNPPPPPPLPVSVETWQKVPISCCTEGFAQPHVCAQRMRISDGKELFSFFFFFCSKSLLFLSPSFQRMTRANTVSTSPSGASSQKIENGRGGRDDCDLIRERMVVQ